MKKCNYNVSYSIYNSNGGMIKSGEMIVKNSFTPVEALVRLEGYLKRKHSDFGNMVVHSHKLHEEPKWPFGDVFKDIFK